MSIKGVSRFYSKKKNHIITTQTEHKCVLDSCRVLQQEGFKVTYIPVQTSGLVDLEELKGMSSSVQKLILVAAMTPETVLCSVMMVK